MKNSRNGQALLESIVASSVLVIGFLSVVSLLSRSLSIYRITVDQYNASFLASEGVEIIKNLVDAGAIRSAPWGSVLPACGNTTCAYEVDYLTDLDSHPPTSYAGQFLSFDPDLQKYGYGFSQTTTFRRRILVEAIGTSELKVNAIVDWTGRGGAAFSMNVEDHFFNWRGDSQLLPQ